MLNVAKATTLKIDQIDEFSLVPRSMGKPANEHAQISLTKAQEGGAQVPTEAPTDIQKALDEIALLKTQNAEVAKRAESEALINKANAEKIAGMEEAAAFAKCEARIVSQGISKALAPDFRAFEKSNPEASGRIESELAKALARANATEAITKQISRAAPPDATSASGKLDALAKARAEKDGIAIHKAYQLVARENSALYTEHVKEVNQ